MEIKELEATIVRDWRVGGYIDTDNRVVGYIDTDNRVGGYVDRI